MLCCTNNSCCLLLGGTLCWYYCSWGWPLLLLLLPWQHGIFLQLI
jgi:hypothetical protein